MSMRKLNDNINDKTNVIENVIENINDNIIDILVWIMKKIQPSFQTQGKFGKIIFIVFPIEWKKELIKKISGIRFPEFSH